MEVAEDPSWLSAREEDVTSATDVAGMGVQASAAACDVEGPSSLRGGMTGFPGVGNGGSFGEYITGSSCPGGWKAPDGSEAASQTLLTSEPLRQADGRATVTCPGGSVPAQDGHGFDNPAQVRSLQLELDDGLASPFLDTEFPVRTTADHHSHFESREGGLQLHYLPYMPGGAALGLPATSDRHGNMRSLSGKASAYDVSAAVPSESRSGLHVHATSAGDMRMGFTQPSEVHATSAGDMPRGFTQPSEVHATSAGDMPRRFTQPSDGTRGVSQHADRGVPGGFIHPPQGSDAGFLCQHVDRGVAGGFSRPSEGSDGGLFCLSSSFETEEAGQEAGQGSKRTRPLEATSAFGEQEEGRGKLWAPDQKLHLLRPSPERREGLLGTMSAFGVEEGGGKLCAPDRKLRSLGPSPDRGRGFLGKASAYEVEEEDRGKLRESGEKLHLLGPASVGGSEDAALDVSAKARALRVCRYVWDSGTACILLSAAIQAVSALCVKQMGDRVPVTQIVVVRSVICFAMSVPIARASNIRPLFGLRKYWPSLWPRALTGTTAMSLYYVAVQHLPLADAMTIFFSNPAITAILSWLIEREPLGLISCTGIAASLGGVTLVTQPPFLFGGHDSWDHNRYIGVMFGIASSVTSAVAYILIRFIPKAVPALVVALWFHTAGIFSMGIPLLVGYPEPAVLPGLLYNVRLVVVGTTSFAVQLLINRAFRLESASKMATMSLTQVLYGHVLGVSLLGDRESLLSIFGTGLIAFGVVTVSLGHGRHTPSAADEDEARPLNAADPEDPDEEGRTGGKTNADGRTSGGRAPNGKTAAGRTPLGPPGGGVLAPLWEGPEAGGRRWAGGAGGGMAEDDGDAGAESEPLFGARRHHVDRAHFEAARGPIAF